jgi:LacI family transcriptional regulator
MTVSRVVNGAPRVRPETRRQVEKAVREPGLAVPGDIAVVCFDDVEHLAVRSPFLTVMNQPAESFGTVAAQLLLDRIAGKTGARPRQVVLQPHLLVRESCGAKAGPPTGRPD